MQRPTNGCGSPKRPPNPPTGRSTSASSRRRLPRSIYGSRCRTSACTSSPIRSLRGHARTCSTRTRSTRGSTIRSDAAERLRILPTETTMSGASGERIEAPLLEARNLTTHFHTGRGLFRAVDGVSFTVDRGRTVGLVGESGCGKSVTSLSVMGLVPSPPGRVKADAVLFEGRDILRLPAADRRRMRGSQMSMIFQEPMTSLNPVHTVGQQIVEGLLAHERLSAKSARERAMEMLELVRIPSAADRLDDFPHRMSGGQRQRVMIAMAIACNPKLLIADEPTTALDVTIQAQILDLLLDLQKRLGMAILMITHNLGVVAEVADEVLVMYAG